MKTITPPMPADLYRAGAEPSPKKKAPKIRYETRLLLLLSLTNGVVALERLSASFLSPYLVADLGLSNAQLGLLAGALSGAVALSAIVFGRIADASKRYKFILVAATLAFSLVAGLPALVGGFGGLVAARMVLGLAEGPVVPVTQAMMAAVSDPRRRGFNMGLLQMGGAFLIGATAGPVLATLIADAYGWRAAFTASVLPGILVVILLARFVRPDRQAPRDTETRAPVMPAWQSLRTLWRVRNVRLAIMISGLFAAWFTIQNVFLPIYLTQAKGLSPTTMGLVVGAGGIAGFVGGLGVPAISDRIGRRPVMIVCGFLAMLAPAAIVLLPPNPWLLAAAVVAGWLVIGTSPLYIGVIPAESAPLALTTSAIALTTASGELIGGVLAPSVAGTLADSYGLAMPFYVCIGCALLCGLLSLRLQESAVTR